VRPEGALLGLIEAGRTQPAGERPLPSLDFPVEIGKVERVKS
jgi:hypothetical protein